MSKLFDYDKGQDYIAISDYISERLEDHNDLDLIKAANRFRALLGDKLDKLESHEFSIYNSDCFNKEYND